MDIFTQLDESKLNNTEVAPSKPSAHQAAGIKSANKPGEKASCPLTAEKLQLIPVRYALVEKDKSDGTLTTQKLNRPIGLRFLRNGWLYVYNEKTKLFHEYNIQNAVPWSNTYTGGKMDGSMDDGSDYTRVATSNSRRLIFEKTGCTLYISYSEVQWSPKKCNQIIENVDTRKRYMQQVTLNGVDCGYQSKHLITKEKAKQWVAEYAEEPNDLIYQEDKKSYAWVDPQEGLSYVNLGGSLSFYSKAPTSVLEDQLSQEVMQQGNYIYLAVEDYLGMFRDLANEQDLVSGYIEEWANTDNNDFRYIMGNYIESLRAYSDQNAQKAKLSEFFFEGLNDQDRASIYKYLKSLQTFREAVRDKGAPSPEEILSDKTGIPAPETTKSRIVKEAQQELKKDYEDMRKQLGEKYDSVVGDINQLNTYQYHLAEGEGLMARGINDLVDLKSMHQFLEVEGKKQQQWQARLDKISDDRLTLFTQGLFQKNAWYFDKDHKDQIDQAKQTEFACIRDLTRTPKHLERLAKFLNENAQYIIPTFYMTSTDPLKDGQKILKTLRAASTAVDGIKKAFIKSAEYKDMVKEGHWIYTSSLSKQSLAFQNLIDGIYIPAIMMGQAELVEKAIQESARTEDAFRDYLQKTTPAMRMLFMQSLDEGFDIITSNPKNISSIKLLFTNYRDIAIRIESITADIVAYRQRLNESPTDDPRYARLKADYTRLTLERDELIAERNKITTSLSEMIAPIGESDSFIGVRLVGTSHLTVQQLQLYLKEANALKAGFIKGYGIENNLKKTLQTKSIRISRFLLFIQGATTLMAYNHYRKIADADKTLKDRLGMGAAVAGTLGAAVSLIQSVWTGMISNVIDNLAKEAEALAIQGKVGGQFASKLGKISISLGFASSALSTFAGAGLIIINWERWTDAIRYGSTGEQVSALVAAGGSIGYTSVSAATALRAGADRFLISSTTASLIEQQAARGIVLSSRAARAAAWIYRGGVYLRAAAVLNPIGLVFTALSIAGELGYNYFHLSAQQKWFEKCCWGYKANEANWDIKTSNQELAESTLSPVLIDNGLVSKYQRELQLVLIGQSDFKEATIRFKAIYNHTPEANDDISQTIKETARLVSKAPLTIAFRIPSTADFTRFRMRLVYQPDIAYKPLREDKGYITFTSFFGPPKRSKPILPDEAENLTFASELPYQTLTLGDLLNEY